MSGVSKTVLFNIFVGMEKLSVAVKRLKGKERMDVRWRLALFLANSVTILTLERTATTPKYAYTTACVTLVMTGFTLSLALVPLALAAFTLSSYSLFLSLLFFLDFLLLPPSFGLCFIPATSFSFLTYNSVQ